MHGTDCECRWSVDANGGSVCCSDRIESQPSVCHPIAPPRSGLVCSARPRVPAVRGHRMLCGRVEMAVAWIGCGLGAERLGSSAHGAARRRAAGRPQRRLDRWRRPERTQRERHQPPPTPAPTRDSTHSRTTNRWTTTQLALPRQCRRGEWTTADRQAVTVGSRERQFKAQAQQPRSTDSDRKQAMWSDGLLTCAICASSLQRHFLSSSAPLQSAATPPTTDRRPLPAATALLCRPPPR